MTESGDYISRETAIESMYKDAEAHQDHTFWTTQYEALLNIPAADVRPVPKPHGRLIDADALKVSLAFAEKTAEWAVPALRAVLMVIDEMPTIIPAEEGE